MTLPEKMQAAVLRGKDELVIEEVAVPEVGPSDVLVEVSHCGVCGSDLHMVLDGWGRRGSIGGHEWSGVVVATGPDVTPMVGRRRGDRRTDTAVRQVRDVPHRPSDVVRRA